MDRERPINQVLIFDVWGYYAHFRRFYTTTSPLTFPIPPRTALCGLIAAIIGKEKEGNEYLNYFTLNKASIGLRLLNPVKKVRVAENLIHTKNARGPGMNLITERTQINFEFLKDQKYRIYFHHVDDDMYQQLKENLIHHKSVYTPSLGLSENIANFEFVGEFNVKSETNGDYVQINSVLPTEKIAEKQGIHFSFEGEYFSIRVPIELNGDRAVTKYSDIFFEAKCKPIEARLISPYWNIEYRDRTNENIVFIE